MNKPISPVIVMFKELPGVRLHPIYDNQRYCGATPCALRHHDKACISDKNPKGECLDRNYIWLEVPTKEQP